MERPPGDVQTISDIQMYVRELAGYGIDLLTALEFVSVASPSADVSFSVAETIFGSFSGNFWTPKQVDCHLVEI